MAEEERGHQISRWQLRGITKEEGNVSGQYEYTVYRSKDRNLLHLYSGRFLHGQIKFDGCFATVRFYNIYRF